MPGRHRRAHRDAVGHERGQPPPGGHRQVRRRPRGPGPRLRGGAGQDGHGHGGQAHGHLGRAPGELGQHERRARAAARRQRGDLQHAPARRGGHAVPPKRERANRATPRDLRSGRRRRQRGGRGGGRVRRASRSPLLLLWRRHRRPAPEQRSLQHAPVLLHRAHPRLLSHRAAGRQRPGHLWPHRVLGRHAAVGCGTRGAPRNATWDLGVHVEWGSQRPPPASGCQTRHSGESSRGVLAA
mmetsp:Transcript_14852/g.47285  ORF Transcript_14852/g.47285 Transcript_14852/m.47285 type:complete len:240 (-) Transcript_14852:878-1597(-)